MNGLVLSTKSDIWTKLDVNLVTTKRFETILLFWRYINKM